MYEELAVPARRCADDEAPAEEASGDGVALAPDGVALAVESVSLAADGVALAVRAKPPARGPKWSRVVRVSIAAVVVAVTLGLGYLAVRYAPALAGLASYGYAGIFALMIVSGGSVLFPVPGMASVFVAGALWNPLLVGLAAGLGNSIGEITGFIAGRSGRTLINADERPFFRRANRFLRRYGFLALVVFAAIPNPVFDIVGLAAGCLGYSLKRFWIAVAIGNTIKYTAMAALAMALSGPITDLLAGFL
jgi:uncharacterized membrane protein YdjX (TVP38/TMEM64 family)